MFWRGGFKVRLEAVALEKLVFCAMDFKSLPYHAGQAMLVAKEVILGERLDATNVFQWDKVRMNLPGSPDYNPALPWVSKIRIEDEKIDADIFI
jgi:hypothetical protein